MIPAKGKRPGQPTGTPSHKHINTASLPTDTELEVEAEAHVAGVYVALVKTSAGLHRRRVYFNLPSAQRAVDRAHMSGHSAVIVLCKLIPAGGGR